MAVGRDQAPANLVGGLGALDWRARGYSARATNARQQGLSSVVRCPRHLRARQVRVRVKARDRMAALARSCRSCAPSSRALQALPTPQRTEDRTLSFRTRDKRRNSILAPDPPPRAADRC